VSQNVNRPPHEVFSVPALFGSHPTSLNTQPEYKSDRSRILTRSVKRVMLYPRLCVCLFVCLSVPPFFRYFYPNTLDEQLFICTKANCFFSRRLADEHL